MIVWFHAVPSTDVLNLLCLYHGRNVGVLFGFMLSYLLMYRICCACIMEEMFAIHLCRLLVISNIFAKPVNHSILLDEMILVLKFTHNIHLPLS